MFLYRSTNVCHRSIIFSIAIDFGLILHEITLFKLIGNGRASKVDGRAQALVGLGLATPLILIEHTIKRSRIAMTDWTINHETLLGATFS